MSCDSNPSKLKLIARRGYCFAALLFSANVVTAEAQAPLKPLTAERNDSVANSSFDPASETNPKREQGSSLAIVALGTAVFSSAVSLSVLLLLMRSDRRLAGLELQQKTLRSHSKPSTWDTDPNQEYRQAIQDLRTRLYDVEHLVNNLRDRERSVLLRPPVARSEQRNDDVVQHQPIHDLRQSEPPPTSLAVGRSDAIPGTLGDDDTVRVTTSSKPMVEIRLAENAGTAEIWVNPDYKFADLTAKYLLSAFDVDLPGPGQFETLSPATVHWIAGSTNGRIVRRGTIRAIRA
jgi:hypothetical protein